MDVGFGKERIFLMSTVVTSLEEATAAVNDLRQKHSTHLKIVNLDSSWRPKWETSSKHDYIAGTGCPCPLESIIEFCTSCESHLTAHSQNVVVLHGGGRLDGIIFMLVCYFMHAGIEPSLDAALHLITSTLCIPTERAISPSQQRYLMYYLHLLQVPEVHVHTLRLWHVRLSPVPRFDPCVACSGCTPALVISILVRDRLVVLLDQRQETTPLRQFKQTETAADIPLGRLPLSVRGDINISVYHQGEKMCGAWFHSAFVAGGHLHLEKSVVDGASLDSRSVLFSPTFSLELSLSKESDIPLLGLDMAECGIGSSEDPTTINIY